MNWNDGDRLEENTLALTNLVSHGVIQTVENLRLNLRHPPGKHLQELVPCVTGTIKIITHLTDYSLATLLDAVNCKELHLFANRLDQEETEALVRTMTSSVETLHLYVCSVFHMDYETFSKYSGDGKCTEMHLHSVLGCDLSSLLDSINVKELHLFARLKAFNQDQTEALVRAMTSRVEILHLGGNGRLNIDFDTLKMYKGDGKCREVHIIEMKDKWLDEEGAKFWADQMDWDCKVRNQDCGYLLSRK